MKVKEVLRMLKDDGWYMVRQTGSHRQFHHPTKPGTVTVAGKKKRRYSTGNAEKHLPSSWLE